MVRTTVMLAAIGCVVASARAQYETTGHSILIPDNNATGAALDLVIADTGIVADLNVGLIITHTWQGDLIATLEHVGHGGPVTIINRPGVPQTLFGYSADNFGNIATGAYFTLDDEAVSVYDRPPVGGGPNDALGIANVTGFWKPDGGLLSDFDGQNIFGTWRLRVFDSVVNDTGAIRALRLGFFPQPPAPPAIALFTVAALLGRTRRRAQ